MNPLTPKSAALLMLGASAIVGALTLAPTPPWAQRGDTVIAVPNEDAAMDAAIAKARSTLPGFWKSYAAPQANEERFAVKVRFATSGGGGEHIWVSSIAKLPDGSYSAKLNNQPRDMPGKKAGDPVTFKEADISDWTFMRRGKIVGNETMRPLLNQIPKAEADKYRAMLESP